MRTKYDIDNQQNWRKSIAKNMEYYLNEEDHNETIYHRKNEEISCRLQQVIEDATTLIAKLYDDDFELQSINLFTVSFWNKQKQIQRDVIPKDKKSITPSSLQNP